MQSPLGFLRDAQPPSGCGPGGFFVSRVVNQVAFLVDGFNLYHSVLDAERRLRRTVRWLDIRSLCESYTRRSLLGRASTLQSVTYFSAYATFLGHTSPASLTRHRTYVQALQATGVEVVLNRFKARWRVCPICRHRYVGYEEKETDVAIAVRIVELAISSDCDTIIVVTGDTDILPALRVARKLAPAKRLWIGAPFRRYNRELRHHADGAFKIRAEAYGRHRLPDPVVAPDGSVIPKPRTW